MLLSRNEYRDSQHIPTSVLGSTCPILSRLNSPSTYIIPESHMELAQGHGERRLQRCSYTKSWSVVDECMHKDNTSDRLTEDSIPRSFKAESADLVAAGHAKEVVQLLEHGWREGLKLEVFRGSKVELGMKCQTRMEIEMT